MPFDIKEDTLSRKEEEDTLSGQEEEEDTLSGEVEEEEDLVSGEEEEEEEEEEETLFGEDEEEYEYGEEEEEEEDQLSGEELEEIICRLSHPARPHTLSRIEGKYPQSGCSSGDDPINLNIFHYHCTTCDVEFHDECHRSPKKMIHPYHPQHPLIFSVQNKRTRILHDSNLHDYFNKKILPESTGRIPDSGKIFYNCTWCGEYVNQHGFSHDRYYRFYKCLICNFCLCYSCSIKFPLPIIKNPKTHHHSLFFFPRPLLVPCDACGLVDKSDPSYACFQCNFVVHRGCTNLPRVIKITRHPHRLFYSPFLSTSVSPCHICYKEVDIKYGQYSCNHVGCSYIVHSRCATHKRVWDGRELEWEPDEVDETEDVASFKKVGDDLIEYFCHEHDLKLEKYDVVRDANKQCQACILHIDSRDFYNCMHCDFYLHEVCANLPRKLDHALHYHSLFLDPVASRHYYTKDCHVCCQAFSGFKYKCTANDCDDNDGSDDQPFQIDVGCLLVPDCFTHKGHEHPLFIPISFNNLKTLTCGSCEEPSPFIHLHCTICEFVMCYLCATLPDKLHYKYDALPLSLCYGEGEIYDETYWCEICEEELDPTEWFYTSNKPYLTVHRSCVFGTSKYMKPGHTIHIGSSSLEVLCNSSNTRPICHGCSRRCSSSVYFKLSDERVVCSFDCLSDVLRRS